MPADIDPRIPGMADSGTDQTRSLTDWTVLGLLVEQPRHGFALVKELSPDTLLGQVWSVPNPMIYRALRVLQAKGMIDPAPSETGSLGPRRTPMRPTTEGRRRLYEWLQLPVDHFRDARILLRVKLHLTIRLGLDPLPLLRAQQSTFTRLGSTVARTFPTGSEIERDLLRIWREDASAAAQDFVAHALDLLDPPRRTSTSKAPCRAPQTRPNPPRATSHY